MYNSAICMYVCTLGSYDNNYNKELILTLSACTCVMGTQLCLFRLSVTSAIRALRYVVFRRHYKALKLSRER